MTVLLSLCEPVGWKITHPRELWDFVNALSVSFRCRAEDGVLVLRWHFVFLREFQSLGLRDAKASATGRKAD